MFKDDAGFVSTGFEFSELEGLEYLEHNFPLVGDPILKIRKFQNSLKGVSVKEIYFRRIPIKKILKDGAGFKINIGFKFFMNVECKNCQLNIGNNDKRLKAHVIRH